MGIVVKVVERDIMTRLVTGPQGILLGSTFLKVVSEVIPPNLQAVFLGDDPDEVIYPTGLGYVRWTLQLPGEPEQPDFEVVQGSYDSLSLTQQSLQSQPWWGNEMLARQIAQELAGSPGGSPELGTPNNNFFGPWLAYGVVENAGIATVSYQGNSGTLTGPGTFQGPQNELFYLIEGNSNPVPGVNLSGPWLPIYQQELAIPISYDGNESLGFDVLETPGVTMTGEIVSI